MNNKSISFVLSSLKFGGGERVVLNLAYALKSRGWDVNILLMSFEGEFLEEASRHFKVFDLDCNRTWKLPFKLCDFLEKNKSTALISSYWKINIASSLIRFRYPKIKLLLWEHSMPSKSTNSPSWLYYLTASIIYRLSTKVVAVSTGVRADILSITFGLNKKIEVILNPISKPHNLPKKSLKITNSFNIVWVGRLAHPKNPQLMLDAFSYLPMSIKYRLDFIGDGPLLDSLLIKTKNLNLEDRVTFHGFQSNPYDFMCNADMLVLTSDHEGLGNVLVEGLYCGLRLVSTDCGGGVNDILDAGRYGSIVEVGNPVALSRAIVEQKDKPINLADQKNGALRFDPELIVDKFLQFLM